MNGLGRRLDTAAALLVLALASGLVLRVLGVGFCYPMLYCHADEHYLVKPAMLMLRTGDLNPHIFVYPSLYIYILLLVSCLTYLVGMGVGHWTTVAGIRQAPFHISGRIATALLGTATLGAVYVAGKRLLDRESGAVAALALAFMPLHVANSHFVTTDVPAAFFCIVALCAAAKVANEGTRRSYVVAGLLAGFAAATKYNAFLVAINLPLAHWLNPRRERFLDANLWRGLVWIAGGFLIACPYSLLDLPNFLEGVANEIAHYKTGHVGHQGEYNRLFYLLFLASRGFGPLLTALGIYGLVEMIRNFRRTYLLLLVFPALYMVFVGGYKVRFVRNLMPVLPYFALWIGFGAVQALRQIRATWPFFRRTPAWLLAALGLLLALAQPVTISVDEAAALARPDTRLQAREWIARKLPRGATLRTQPWSVDALPPGMCRQTNDRFVWDYYVGTDRLSRKYFNMHKWDRIKYREVREAFSQRPVAVFPGREENPFYYTASPTVFIFARDPDAKAKPPQ